MFHLPPYIVSGTILLGGYFLGDCHGTSSLRVRNGPPWVRTTRSQRHRKPSLLRPPPSPRNRRFLFHFTNCCFCSAAKSCLTLQPRGPQRAGLPCPPSVPQFAQICVRRVGDAVSPPHALPPLLRAPSVSHSIGVSPVSQLTSV